MLRVAHVVQQYFNKRVAPVRVGPVTPRAFVSETGNELAAFVPAVTRASNSNPGKTGSGTRYTRTL